MQIDSSLIHAFLHDLPMEQTSGYSYVSGFQQPDSKRKDVVSALLSELETIVEEFPVFNKDIWLSLFSDMDELLASLTIIPVVGSTSAPMRTEVFKHNVIILDLIHIADYTKNPLSNDLYHAKLYHFGNNQALYTSSLPFVNSPLS